ncbi:MAG: hypothetical protein UW41_C0032G0008 [Candidatus Collierbacteria bacterium GW2011_GWC2_44_18]|uniref:Methyltransferase FkbM domain-containing protein n=1 Tax=Candidatus Collierbacteria bacterium GW2011_GWC2_44_18 TaxID=1618392 RepID=A0A0G1HN51_9BACT|nr:MAG: hypothetical protein UW41_C0032G0008 [Candidatus Collierbacteria bacterium GW2011_GWC2_44_18]
MMKFIEKIRDLLYLSPLYDWLGKRSYAQSGEDLIAWGELAERVPRCHSATVSQDKGFYVDVGAYHPKLFSNTYLFYKKGWRGICVDPNPKMKELYRIARPRDVFLNVGVGAEESVTAMSAGRQVSPCHGEKGLQGDSLKAGMMEYFEFEEGAANTFSPEQARKNQEVGRKLIGKRMVPILPLKKIFAKYLPKGQQIDLLSVDVEGMDLEVLKSNDWKKYRPRMIICEDLEFDLDNKLMRLHFDGQARGPAPTNKIPLDPLLTRGKQEGVGVVGFLMEKGYRLTAKTPYSLIFKGKTVE